MAIGAVGDMTKGGMGETIMCKREGSMTLPSRVVYCVDAMMAELRLTILADVTRYSIIDIATYYCSLLP